MRLGTLSTLQAAVNYTGSLMRYVTPIVFPIFIVYQTFYVATGVTEPLLHNPIPLQSDEGGEHHLKEATMIDTNNTNGEPLRKCVDLGELKRSCGEGLVSVVQVLVLWLNVKR